MSVASAFQSHNEEHKSVGLASGEEKKITPPIYFSPYEPRKNGETTVC